MTALELAKNLLSECQGNLLNLYELSFEQFQKQKGIGPVKAVQLKAVAELSRRIARTGRGYQLSLSNPSSIAEYYMEDLRHRREEVFFGAFFDAKCRFLGDSQITTGSLCFAYVSPMELFRAALLKNALLIVALHNHPSGDPAPSREDVELTRTLEEGARLLGLTLADHIIIGDRCYYSFKENHLLE